MIFATPLSGNVSSATVNAVLKSLFSLAFHYLSGKVNLRYEFNDVSVDQRGRDGAHTEGYEQACEAAVYISHYVPLMYKCRTFLNEP